MLTREQLAVWVNYARDKGAVILFDAAYEAFISEKDVPHTIYEIDGAKEVAIEFRSFSKTAGFTGTRCGYTVVPKSVKALSENGERVALNKLWLRRQTTKFNGVSYAVQRAAEATYTPEGKRQVRSLIDYYMDNARIIRQALQSIGMSVYGGWCSVYLGENTRQDGELGLFRLSAEGKGDCLHAGASLAPQAKAL